MIAAGAAWAVGGGLLNSSFEQGSGSSLDNWKVATYRYSGGVRNEVYGPSTSPVPCAAGDPYGICVIEGQDSFVGTSLPGGEQRQYSVPVLDGQKMVRLGGPFLNPGIEQNRDGLTIQQTFTVDSSDPVVPLNYNFFGWDDSGFDDLSLIVRLTSPGEEPVAKRFQAGSGIGGFLFSSGWQRANLDLGGYEGQSVSLEIEFRGTADRTLGSWVYVDAGTPRTPYLGNQVDIEVPSQAPSGSEIDVHRYVDAGSGRVSFTVPMRQAFQFPDACMPYTVAVPFDPVAGSLDHVEIADGNQRVDATEGPDDVWKASFDCAMPTDLRMYFAMSEANGSQDRAVTLGSLAVVDPIGVVYDSDIYDGLKAQGKSDLAARAGALVSGAEVTLQRRTSNAFVTVKPGDELIFPSVTPQVTTDDGEFQWLLSGGEYRVSVSHPDYQTATSRWVSADTLVSELNVGLIPKARGPRLAPVIGAKPPAITAGRDARFGFARDPSEILQVTGFECSLDRAAFSACSESAAYRGLKPGRHDFSVRAVNSFGQGPVASYSWTIQSLAISGLKARAARKAVRKGRKATVTVSFRNSGTATIKGAKVCIRGPKKVVKVPACKRLVSVASGKTATTRFKVKVKKSTRAKKAKLRIVVSGGGLARKSTATRIRIR